MPRYQYHRSGRKVVSVELTDDSINRTIRLYRTFARHRVEAGNEVVEKYLVLIYREAKQLVPIDTGSLKASIEWLLEETGSMVKGFVSAGGPLRMTPSMNPAGGAVSGRVNNPVVYAAFVELGTRMRAATPFLFPAFMKYRAQFLSELILVMTTNVRVTPLPRAA